MSKILNGSSCLDSYFSWDIVCVDSNLNGRYTRFVTAYVLMYGNMVSYAAPDERSLMCVARFFPEVMMPVLICIYLYIIK